MLGEEAKVLLGFLPDSTPSSSQVKEAYKKKALETHPDRFPLSQRSLAESNFKLISEAYTCLQEQLHWGDQVPLGPTGDRKRRTPHITLFFLEITYI
ncbi:chaperone DnaJ-domain superfamily protein [Tanacetum coccineum]